jgi:hypothetical protein
MSRQRLANGLLAAGSVAFTWLTIEILLFRLLLPVLPLKLHGYLDEGLRTLAQSSKQAAVPRNYIALVGDSYAQGLGDWLLQSDPDRNPPFHSAHLIAERTGRDVISFGASGAGSLRGLVGEPLSQFAYINASMLFRLTPPDEILVYFYEGNDLNNNLEDLATRYAGRYAVEKIQDPEYFRNFIREVAVEGDPVFKAAQSFSLADNLFCFKMVWRLLTEKATPYQAAPFVTSGSNRAVVAGSEVLLPDELQGPSLELTEEELEIGLSVFEQSLLFLADRFRGARVTILYVPSPLASYWLSSPTVSAQSYEGRGVEFPSDLVHERSDRICSEVERIAATHGFGFVDPRSAIRAAAATQLVHGPEDWKHFNRAGYTSLAEELLRKWKPARARSETTR